MSVLDDFLSVVDTGDDDMYSHEAINYAVYALDMSKAGFMGFSISATFDIDSVDRLSDIETTISEITMTTSEDSTVSATLPQSILDGVTTGEEEARFTFTLFRNDTLFSAKNMSERFAVGSVILNAVVVKADLNDLADPIMLSFKKTKVG